MAFFISWVFEKVIDILSLILGTFLDFLFKYFNEMMEMNTTFENDSTLDLFFSVFPLAKISYGLFVVIGWFIIFWIFMFQMYKIFFSGYNEGEDPLKLVLKSCVFAVIVYFSKNICKVFFYLGTIPYAAIKGLDYSWSNVSFSDLIPTSVAELGGAVAGSVAIGLGQGSVLLLITCFLFMAIGTAYFTLILEVCERYVVLGCLAIFSPLALATGISKSTSGIAASWFKMMGAQCVMMSMSVFFIRNFHTGLEFMIVSDMAYPFFLVLLLLLAWLITGQRIDSHLAKMGLSTAQTGMGLAGAVLASARMGMQASHATNSIMGTIGNTGIGKKLGIQNQHITTDPRRMGQKVPGAKNGEKFGGMVQGVGQRASLQRDMALQMAGKPTSSKFSTAANMINGNMAKGVMGLYNGMAGEDAKSENTKENGKAILSNFANDDKMNNLANNLNLEAGTAEKGKFTFTGTDTEGNKIIGSISDTKDDKHTVPIMDNDGNIHYGNFATEEPGANSGVVKGMYGEQGLNYQQTAGAIDGNSTLSKVDNPMPENSISTETVGKDAVSNDPNGNLAELNDGSMVALKTDPEGQVESFSKLDSGEFALNEHGDFVQDAASGAMISKADVKGSTGSIIEKNSDGTLAIAMNGQGGSLTIDGAKHQSLDDKIAASGGANVQASARDPLMPERYSFDGKNFSANEHGEYMKIAGAAGGMQGYIPVANVASKKEISTGSLPHGSVLASTDANGRTSYLRTNENGISSSTYNKGEAFANTPLKSGTVLRDYSTGQGFALSQSSFKSDGSLNIKKDDEGTSYITDSNGQNHPISSIERNGDGGYKTYENNVGDYVQTTDGIEKLYGGNQENAGSVRTYSMDNESGGFMPDPSGDFVKVASHGSSIPEYRQVDSSSISSTGEISSFNYGNNTGFSHFNTSPVVENTPYNYTHSYEPSTSLDSSDYYKDNNGNYREISALSTDSNGGPQRYSSTASGFVPDKNGDYVFETRVNSQGQTEGNAVYVGYGEIPLYSSTTYANGFKVDNNDNLIIPTDALITNKSSGVYEVSSSDGTKYSLFNASMYSAADPKSNNIIKTTVDGNEYYVANTSPPGAGILSGKSVPYSEAQKFIDFKQFPESYGHAGNRTYNDSILYTDRAASGILELSGRESGILLDKGMFKEPEKYTSTVHDRTGKEYYFIDSKNHDDKTQYVALASSYLNKAQKLFYDRRYEQKEKKEKK